MKNLFALLLLLLPASAACIAQDDSAGKKVFLEPKKSSQGFGLAEDGPDSLTRSVVSSYTLRSITILGNRRTRPSILRREMALRENDRLFADSLRFYIHRDSLRLQNTNLFTDVALQFVRADSMLDLFVVVKERWYIWPELGLTLADRNFNVWWTEQNRDLRRANLMFSVADRNFRGNMEYLKVGGQLGYTRRATLEYRRPYVDRKQRHGVGLSLGYSENAEHYYTTDSNKLRFARIGTRPVIREVMAGVGYTYRPGYATRHSAEVYYRDFRIQDTIAWLNPDFFENSSRHLRFIEAIYRYDFNGVNNWNYPLTGRRFILIGTARLGLEGMRFQSFLRAEAGFYQKLSRRWYASQIFRGRVMLPGDLPYYLRGALGGATEYVRGYEYYVVDGSHYGLLRGNLKFQLLNKTFRNLPFRFLPTLPLAVYPKIFADAGWAHNRYPGNSFLNDRLLYGYGFGLDLITAYDFKLRFELSWNGLSERGFFLHQEGE